MDSLKAPALSREPLPTREKPSIFIRLLRFSGAVIVGILIGVVWVGFHSPRLNRILRSMGEERHIMQEEMTAPGTNELSKAGPCARASVKSPENRKRTRELAAGRHHATDAPDDETVILCVTPMFRDPPECDALARTYVDAAHPTAPFRMSVTGKGKKAACSFDYDSSGARITRPTDGGI